MFLISFLNVMRISATPSLLIEKRRNICSVGLEERRLELGAGGAGSEGRWGSKERGWRGAGSKDESKERGQYYKNITIVI